MTLTAPDLIPVRALNQVTYCERLYYLMYVDSVMPTNEHVESGLFEHRRVTAPDLTYRTRKEGDAERTRSVTLSSERLGLIATLDIVEEKGGVAYPVEVKHGSAPRDDGGRPTGYDNDAVQLCAQGMLLEESLGTPVRRGVLSYGGSKDRVEVALDDALRERTRAAVRQVREAAARPTPPPPLPPELRHRCHGCSLLTVCLPDETLYQIERAARPAEEAATPALTRVVPGSDDGAVVYVQEPGARVGKRSQHLTIHKDGAELTRVPLALVRQVVVCGNVQVSTQALECLTLNDIPVAYLNRYGRFFAALQPAPTKNVALRLEQYRRFADPEQALTLAKAVVRAKLTNQRTLLMRTLRNRAEGEGDAVRGSHERAARDLAELLRRLERVTEVESLLGVEGQGAALYFGEFHRFLKAEVPGRGFDFRCRNRRPPRDPVNALLSFAYALLAKDCFAALCTVGFDPYIGFYHGSGRHGRPSLALDLMEEFRTILADSVVLTLVNTRLVTPDDFLTYGEACQLTDAGRRTFFKTWETRKATLVRHPVFGYQMTYSRMLEVQARMLAAYVRGELPAYTGFTVR